ncbi:TonB-dependent receptor [Oceanicoccus sp. KOV_DT_Chl]|uniref:TonB-dependent receptor n=1 Tax=Oceanicoccus sp. KOV_DT_Chl TaxID=1904639 RepID=UPI0011AF4AC8|nr:TonB-dependent receptor [Oceanicoccus sp. KOV_DT_Chl]
MRTPIQQYKLKVLTLACATALPLTALPVVAQVAEKKVALEEVLVTARKRQESMQDIPVTVTSITEALNRSSLQSLQDLQDYVPNVQINRIATNNGASISIRGISFQDPDKSMDAPVGVILDGVYQGTIAGGLLNNFDLERVEVLRGPQGTLFGKNTTAGALNVIRTAPTKELGAKVRVGFGSWDKQQVQAVVNTPLTSKGGLKFFVNKEEHDGYIENNIADTDVGILDYQQFGATIAFDITDKFDISFTAEKIDDDSDAGAFANLNDFADLNCLISVGAVTPDPSNPPIGSGCSEFDANSDEDHSSQNAPNSSETTTEMYNLTMNWDLGNSWSLTSITGYTTRDEEFRLEYDASQVEFLYVNGTQDYEQTTQEFRINGDINDKMKLTAGVYYFDSEYDQFQESFDMWYYIPLPVPGSDPVVTATLFGPDGGLPPGAVSSQLGSVGQNTSYAVFASLDWQLTDKLLLNIGARQTEEERRLEGRTPNFVLNLGAPVEISPSGPLQKFKDDWSEFSPRVALQYTINEDVMVFGSFSSGFKSGGFFARTQNTDDITSFDPEYVDTYEIGMKSEWLNNRVRFNATAFYSDYTDKQEEEVIDTGGGNVTTIVYNAADAKIQGLEIELTGQVTADFSAFLNIGLLDAEFTDFEVGVLGSPGVTVDVSDRELRNAPDTTIAIGVDYVTLISVGEFGAHYNYRWRDEVHSVLTNDERGLADSAGFHNASLDLTIDEKYKVSVYGRNLTDERFVRAIPIGISTFGQYNPPRNYGIEFTAKF